MRNHVEILSLKENKIIIKKNNKTKKFLLPISLSVIVLFVTFFSIGGTSIIGMRNYLSYVFDPVNSLYSDNSTIIFTSLSGNNKENLNFTLPIISGNVNVNTSGDIILEVTNSIMVKSIEGGIIEDVGMSNDGVKYIKILHSLSISSMIENVDMVGVKIGDNVKKGQDIATAKLGNIVTLRLYENDIQMSNIKINQSKIICQK